MKRKYCKQCGKKLAPKKGNGIKKKYCNQSCLMTWRYYNIPSVNRARKENSKRQSRERAKNPRAKAKQKAYFDKWRKENREHFNEIARNSMRRRLKIKPENYRL